MPVLLVAGLLFPALATGATQIAQPVLVAATVPAQPPDTTPTPGPAPAPVADGCEDGLPIPVCASATPDAPVDRFPLTLQDAPPPADVEPCEGFGCLPNVPAPGFDPGAAGGSAPGVEPAREPCGFTDLGGCVSNAITDFFRGVVTAALNPLLDLLSNTLLTTPELDTLPGLAELWSNSWQIMLACYGLLVLVAAIVIMSFESLQTRYTAKEIAPRIVVGFLAAALSLWAATRAVEVANSLSRAVMVSPDGGSGLDPTDAGQALREITLESLDDGTFILFVGVFLVGMLLALLVGYVIRVALTVILVAGAPIALMLHALPQTEHIAYWWWKALAGCLAIQVVQSLTLITAMRVLLTPGGFTLFGPTADGLVNLLVACALMYILYKIPFWVLGSIRGGGRSLVGSLVRGFVAYKTFGLLSGRGSKDGEGNAAGRGGRGRGGRASGGGDDSGDPYGGVRADSDGQYMLPLTGLRRVRPARRTGGDTPPAPGASVPGRGRQLALPLGEDWPENRPVLGRDGQYQLSIDAPRRARTPSTPPGTRKRGSTTPGPAPRRRRAGVQLELPLDPYQGNRARRDGQYPLPLDGVHRVHRTPTPTPTPPASPRRTTTGRRPRQLELPFDPYRDNRPDRSGQYPLPLDDLRRVPCRPPPAPTSTPAPTAAVRPAPAPARPAARAAGQQLRLPIGLPTPTRPPANPAPPAPATGPPGRRSAGATGTTPAARPAAATPARDEPGPPPRSDTPPARRTPPPARRPRRSRPTDPTGGTS